MSIKEMISTQPLVQSSRPSRLFGIKIIKAQFQFKFSMFVFVGLALAAGAIWIWGVTAVDKIIESGMVTGDDAILALQIVKSNIKYISILSLAALFGLALFYSHFIAGPVYRFEKTFEDMSAGNISMYVKLRKYDEFQDTAVVFNQALAGLRSKVKKERETLDAVLGKALALVERLKQSGHAAEAAELDGLIKEIKNSPPQIKI
ncbi:MAG: methyl-accepting chemotaxis protein [Elusimicrobia bacterium]|nr:methyl-accepting chemotaxis protein [Candidatus Obscuribacterium magneticum]